MFNLDIAPQYGQRHPNLYGEAFDISYRRPEEALISPLSILQKAFMYVNGKLNKYEPKGSNLDTALREGTANCMARSILFHTLVSPFEHISSGVAIVHYDGVGSHWFNTFSARQDDLDTVVDNYDPESKSDDVVPGSKLLIVGKEREFEGHYGGVSNVHELLQKRRSTGDFDTNEETVYMLRKPDSEIKLTSITADDYFDIKFPEDDTASRPDLVFATIFFNEMATAVVDTMTGHSTTLADEDLKDQLWDIHNGRVITHQGIA